MAPRGLSAEDKRVKLLEIFHESKDFFQLRELEKSGPKLKGIVSQSVKEVLQSLVDDGLVQADKIGSSNFFWSFPSQNGAALNARLKTIQETRAANQAQIDEAKSQIEVEMQTRVESDYRTESLAELARLKKELAKLDTELGAYGACDPVKLEETRRGIILAKEAAIRWTDNFLVALPSLQSRTTIDASEIRQHLGVEETYEDIC